MRAPTRTTTMPEAPAQKRDQQRQPQRGNGKSTSRRALDGVISDMRQLVEQVRSMPNVSDRERVLQDDNFRVRRSNAKLRDRIADLEASSGEVPEGHVVVKKEDADELEQWRALQLKHADVKAALAERDTLKKEKTAAENETVHAEAAETLGYPNVPALTDLIKRDGLHVEMRTVKRDDPETPGKKVSVAWPYVRPADKQDAPFVPLDEHVATKWSAFEPALLAEPEADDDADETSTSSAPSTPAVPATMRRASSAASTLAAAAGGVAIPAVRRAQQPSQTSRSDKQLDELIAQKRAKGAYSI